MQGDGHPHCVAALVAILVALGHHHLVLKSDDEPAIVDLKRRAAQECREKHGMTILPEESPHADSQSNGLVEGAVRDIKAVARSLRFAAGGFHETDISAKRALLPWLVSYSGAVANRSQRGVDGLTPSRRWKARDFLGRFHRSLRL